MELHRLNGETAVAELSFPDEVGALILKATVTREREKATDLVDLWRCLEVAFASGVTPSDFTGSVASEAAEITRRLFARRDCHGMARLLAEQRLTGGEADRQSARVRALVARVVGST